jgi:prephenate dehydrogenase
VIVARRLRNCDVTIIGLGLMGGSLAGALRGQCRTVVGVARRSEVVKRALALGLVDRATTDIVDGVHSADVVVLATPVRVILHQMADLAPLLPEGCILMDLGSTKAQIVSAMESLPDHIQPLGGHPMCGKEVSGIEVADPTLYRGTTFILTPLERTTEETLTLGQELARSVGAQPLVLDANRQDFLVGTMSHLPYLLACALVATADATTSPDPAAWEIVAGGFRDTSRVSGSDVTMMLDILLTNSAEVLRAVDTFQSQLQKLTEFMKAGDEDGLRAALDATRKTRLKMFP